MALFRYQALDAGGRFVSGEIEAGSAGDAARLLAERGLHALETAPERQGGARGWRAQPRPASQEVTALLGDLALMLRSGLPLVEALELLEGGQPRRLAGILNRMRQEILAGASFRQAIQQHREAFPEDVVAMIRVAEATGGLESVLEAIAAQRRRTELLFEKINTALRYPAFLFCTALAVLLFFLVFVVPQFAGVIQDFGGNPGGYVRSVIALSDFLRGHGEPMALGALALLAAGLVAAGRPRLRGRLRQGLGRLPILRGLAGLYRTARFCRSLGTLLGHGVTLTEALRVIADMDDRGSGTLEQIVAAVRRGARLTDALLDSKIMPPVAIRMLQLGEQTGDLAVVAQRAADYYEAKLEARLNRMAGLFGPVAIIAVSILIGSLIVSIMSTLLSINQLAM